MEPWMAPINGISLERYAEVSAELGDTTDPDLEAEIVARHGLHRVDWEAAKQGWAARMADASLMGRVASAFTPIYQAALARRAGDAPSTSFDEFVAMSGAAKAFGTEGMLAHYGISATDWNQIAGHWKAQVAQNPTQYGEYGMLVEQEGTRIREGGPPKPVSVAKGASSPRPAVSGQAAGAISAGSPVLVLWNDGQRYPGAVVQSAQGQHLVAFPDGRQVWVASEYVSPR
jgi:hypothetical protein